MVEPPRRPHSSSRIDSDRATNIPRCFTTHSAPFALSRHHDGRPLGAPRIARQPARRVSVRFARPSHVERDASHRAHAAGVHRGHDGRRDRAGSEFCDVLRRAAGGDGSCRASHLRVGPTRVRARSRRSGAVDLALVVRGMDAPGARHGCAGTTGCGSIDSTTLPAHHIRLAPLVSTK